MVQFNLLPDVKLEFMRTRRLKRMVMTVSLAVGAVSLALFVGMFLFVNVVQRQHLSDLDADINKALTDLQAVPDINKVLTVQNQLNSLSSLHAQKPAAGRALNYLGKLTPQKASISDANIDFDSQTISIVGSADSLATVNKFADTLKFTTYTSGAATQPTNAFSEVVLSSFGVSSGSVNYQLDFKFDAAIFDNAQTVELSVPNKISTRSQTEKPSDLFQKSTNTQSGQ